MPEVATLNTRHSTTRIETSEKPKIAVDPESKEPTLLFAPSDITVQGEGGVGKWGYFKQSFDNKLLTSRIFFCKLYIEYIRR
jgi:hypothetical protein